MTTFIDDLLLHNQILLLVLSKIKKNELKNCINRMCNLKKG